MWAALTNGSYRDAGSTMKALRQGGPVTARGLLAEVRFAADCQASWAQIALPNTRPHPPSNIDPLDDALTALMAELDPLLGAFGSHSPNLDLESLGNWLPRLAADSITPYQIVRLGECEREVTALGGAAILVEIRSVNRRQSRGAVCCATRGFHRASRTRTSRSPRFLPLRVVRTTPLWRSSADLTASGWPWPSVECAVLTRNVSFTCGINGHNRTLSCLAKPKRRRVIFP